MRVPLADSMANYRKIAIFGKALIRILVQGMRWTSWRQRSRGTLKERRKMRRRPKIKKMMEEAAARMKEEKERGMHEETR